MGTRYTTTFTPIENHYLTANMPFVFNPFTENLDRVGSAGSGDVVGPASATNNAVPSYDGTTGKLIKNNPLVQIDGSGNLTAANLSGSNTGDQTITLTGDVTGSGTGTFAATIANDAVTYAKMQNVSATDRVLGRETSGAGNVEEIVMTAAGRALMDDASAAAQRATLSLDNVTNVAQLPLSYLDTDSTMAADSDTKVPSQKATKAYVDAVAQGLAIKNASRLATAAALPAYTYNNGASGVGATLTASATGVLTVDGSAVALNDLIIVKNETGGNAPYNGIYLCTTAGAIGVAYILTRSTQMDTTAEFVGAFSFVTSGSTNMSTAWVCSNTSNPTVGTTDIVITQFGGATAYVAGDGLDLTGLTFSVNVDDSTLEIVTDDLQVKDDGITFAKVQNIATSRVLGRTTASSGNVEELTVNSPITLAAGAVDFDETVTLGNNARVTVSVGGTDAGTRRTINFIEGNGISISAVDDAGNEEVDVTIEDVGGGDNGSVTFAIFAGYYFI